MSYLDEMTTLFHPSFIQASPRLSQPCPSSNQQISTNLYYFLHEAFLGPVGSSHSMIWSDYYLNQAMIDPSTSLQKCLLTDRLIYRRNTLYQLLELYAMHNQGQGIGVRRKSGWLQTDPLMVRYFPNVAFPVKTREFILNQIQPVCSNFPPILSKKDLDSDQLIQLAYDYFKYYYAH